MCLNNQGLGQLTDKFVLWLQAIKRFGTIGTTNEKVGGYKLQPSERFGTEATIFPYFDIYFNKIICEFY